MPEDAITPGDAPRSSPRSAGMADIAFPRITHESDEDAVLPQRLRRWTARTIWAMVGSSVVGGLVGMFFGNLLAMFAGNPGSRVIGLMVPTVTAGLSALMAYRSIRRLPGTGQRVSNRALPTKSPELPRRSASHFVSTSSTPPMPMPSRHVARLLGSKRPISCTAITSDGRLAVAGNDEGRVILWDVQTGFELFSIPAYEKRTTAVAFSPDGALIAATGIDPRWKDEGSGTVHIWDSATGQELRRIVIERGLFSICFLPDGRQILLGGCDYVRVWELDGPSAVAMIGITEAVFSSNQIRAVAVDTEAKVALAGRHESQDIWLVNLARAEKVRKLSGHKGAFFSFRKPAITSLAFSPDGMRAISGCLDQTARVWNILTGECNLVFTGHRGFWGWRGVVGVAWLPDETHAVSASEDGTLRVWDVRTGEESRRHQHGGRIRCLAITPDGRTALTGGGDGIVRVHTLE